MMSAPHPNGMPKKVVTALAVSLAVLAFVAFVNGENDTPPAATGGAATDIELFHSKTAAADSDSADLELHFDDALAAAPATSLKSHGIKKQIRRRNKKMKEAFSKKGAKKNVDKTDKTIKVGVDDAGKAIKTVAEAIANFVSDSAGEICVKAVSLAMDQVVDKGDGVEDV